MNVILVNGSPRAGGCTFTGLSIIKEQLAESGVDAANIELPEEPPMVMTNFIR
jgi:multimeric flavodoxin WrbA